jgi:hypothetical protein
MANSDLKLFFLIRYNLSYPACPGKCLDPDWLQRRAFLFKDQCLPSLRQQVDKRFCVLLIVHPLTPPLFLDDLAAALKDLDHKLVFMEQYTGPVVNTLLSSLAVKAERIICTRLDSDDFLSKNFVLRIRTAVASIGSSGPIPFFVVFPFGFSCYSRYFFLFYFDKNQFVSVVSHSNRVVSPLDYDHTKIPKELPVHRILSFPLWCSCSHSANIVNKPVGIWLPSFFPSLLGFHIPRLSSGSNVLSCKAPLRISLEYLHRVLRKTVLCYTRGIIPARWLKGTSKNRNKP